MKKVLLLIVGLLLINVNLVFGATTISITDGNETVTIVYEGVEEIELNTAIFMMGALKYRMNERLDPVVESGNSNIEQIGLVIKSIINGIAGKIEIGKIDVEAEIEKKKVKPIKPIAKILVDSDTE